MSPGLEHIMGDVERAGQLADHPEGKRLRSIAEALKEPTESSTRRERLAESKQRLEGLTTRTAGDTRRHISNVITALEWELGGCEGSLD